jgi:hypothetical protein
MLLRIGDRPVDETGEWEVVGRPYTTASSSAHSPRRTGQPGEAGAEKKERRWLSNPY